jgi:hypothetical protein
VKGGEGMGVETADLAAVKRGHLTINSRNSGMVILLAGLNSKIRFKMVSSSRDRGRIDLRNFGSFM